MHLVCKYHWSFISPVWFQIYIFQQPEVVKRDIRFARQLQIASKVKVPFPHCLSVVMRESHSQSLQLMTQGTADIVLDCCDDFWDGSDLRPLTAQERKRAQVCFYIDGRRVILLLHLFFLGFLPKKRFNSILHCFLVSTATTWHQRSIRWRYIYYFIRPILDHQWNYPVPSTFRCSLLRTTTRIEISYVTGRASPFQIWLSWYITTFNQHRFVVVFRQQGGRHKRCGRLFWNAVSSGFYWNGHHAISGTNWYCSINRAIGPSLCSFRSFQQGKRTQIQSIFGKNGFRVRMELSHFVAEWKYQVNLCHYHGPDGNS